MGEAPPDFNVALWRTRHRIVGGGLPAMASSRSPTRRLEKRIAGKPPPAVGSLCKNTIFPAATVLCLSDRNNPGTVRKKQLHLTGLGRA